MPKSVSLKQVFFQNSNPVPTIPGTVVEIFDFSGPTEYDVDFTNTDETFGNVKSVIVNNWTNENDLNIYVDNTQHNVKVPAKSYAIVPIIAMRNSRFLVSSFGTTNDGVNVAFNNFILNGSVFYNNAV